MRPQLRATQPLTSVTKFRPIWTGATGCRWPELAPVSSIHSSGTGISEGWSRADARRAPVGDMGGWGPPEHAEDAVSMTPPASAPCAAAPVATASLLLLRALRPKMASWRLDRRPGLVLAADDPRALFWRDPLKAAMSSWGSDMALAPGVGPAEHVHTSPTLNLKS